MLLQILTSQEVETPHVQKEYSLSSGADAAQKELHLPIQDVLGGEHRQRSTVQHPNGESVQGSCHLCICQVCGKQQRANLEVRHHTVQVWMLSEVCLRLGYAILAIMHL